ncbi:enoyl-CoA hydratase [Marinobacterium aestuarii]|uniref:Enoyl-CoA hydratase n=1 Tax=Marinobacterium aestuarii TaxID=1821621 RepID=A0A1A9EZ33_9GAMM|nr:enoyl-CoA hydratase/isomerase family protein [Marinobacterium aestuarii]ANG62743.1 enoyl-CoA hydratase [Marinobacterium aestuarii]
MSNEQVRLIQQGHVAEILIERPEKLNALTVSMLEALYSIVLKLDEDPSIRVVILRTAGERAFCVGADINAWGEYAPLDMWRSWIKRGHRVFDALAGLRQPVIAVIQGPALGGGFELALAADLRVADEKACFGLPEAAIATCPGWSGSQRLAKLINPSLIKELIFTGRRLDAQRALSLGLVNEVAEQGTTLARARALAAEICVRAPVSVQLGKQMVDAGAGDNAAMIIEAMAGGLAALTQDAREGVSAFRERRQPEFKGE